ncbi:hypothetical protein [Spirosoma harenae]
MKHIFTAVVISLLSSCQLIAQNLTMQIDSAILNYVQKHEIPSPLKIITKPARYKVKTSVYRLIGEAELDSLTLLDYKWGQYDYTRRSEGSIIIANTNQSKSQAATKDSLKKYYSTLSKQFQDLAQQLDDSLKKFAKEAPVLEARIKSKTYGNREFFYTTTEIVRIINDDPEEFSAHFLVSKDLVTQKQFIWTLRR